MSLEELSKLHLNQRVSISMCNRNFQLETIYGYVMKIYKGNYQIKVWFDLENKPRVVGYTQVEIVN